MKTLAKCHVCNHCVIGEKAFKNLLIGPGKLPGISRNGPLKTFWDAFLVFFFFQVPKSISQNTGNCPELSPDVLGNIFVFQRTWMVNTINFDLLK